VNTVQHGKELISTAEADAKKDPEKLKSLGHAVPLTMAPGESVKPKTMAPSETWTGRLGHPVNMAKTLQNPALMRVQGAFSPTAGKQSHRAPDSTPIYLYQSSEPKQGTEEQESYQQLKTKPARLFTNLLHCIAA